MKRLELKIFIIVALLFAASNAFAQGIDIGFHVGLSTPNDQISNVYNKDKISLNNDSIGNLASKGMDAGYHIAVKGRIGLSDNADFFVGFGFHRFPQTDIEVKDPVSGNTLATLASNTNIIPITAGLNLYLLRTGLGVYVSGDLAYNYISSSLDYTGAGIDIPISKTPSDSRLGFGVGAGIDVPLGLIMLNLEAKYNYLNLIGKEDSEGTKNYLSFGLGVYF